MKPKQVENMNCKMFFSGQLNEYDYPIHFSMIIYSGTMEVLKWLKHLQIHIFVVGIQRQMQKSSKNMKTLGKYGVLIAFLSLSY